jgi:CubicO group peptidase (beta-lactamase class C family)
MLSRLKSVLVVGLAILCAPPPGAAAQQDTRVAAVKKLLEPWDAPDRPGASVSVMIDGRIVANFAVGSADLEHRIPIRSDSAFQAASISKQVTAFAVLLLERDGKLSIDDPVARYLPETAPLGPITLRQLLTHTSGLREYLVLLAAAGWRSEDLLTDQQVLRLLVAQRGTNFRPGTGYQYINSDYVLLAEIVRRISGKTLDGFCQERIFGPIGMTHSRFEEDVGTLIANRVHSYRRVKGSYARAILNDEVAGPSNLVTTAEDLNRWAHNLETGAVGGARVLARMAERGVLADGTVNAYAMGQDLYRFRGFDTWMHGGRHAGFRSFLLRVPSEHLSVAVFGNVADFNSGKIATEVAEVYLAGRPGYRGVATKGTPTAEQLAAFAGTYELFPGLIFNLTTDGRQLWLTTLGGAKSSALKPLSPTSFATDQEAWITLEFPSPVDGKTSGFTYRVGFDGFIAAKRITLAPFTAEAAHLQDYVGHYYSPELATEYELRIENGGLVARHPRRPDIALHPYQRDRLLSREWFFQNLEFQRGAKDQVIGFRLSGVNAEGLTFKRTEVTE